jgi:type IV pilus assembly protein PilW
MNIRSRSSAAIYRKNLGVTLIELMISLTIGLVIIAGIGSVFISSRSLFRAADALSRMQEGARTAFEIMGRDIRMAGFTGCPLNPAATGDINILTTPTTWYKNLIGQPLIGYEKTGGAWSAFPVGVTGVVGNVVAGDALTVLHADNSNELIVSSHNTGMSQITLTANHNINQGQILLVAKDDCSRTAIFQKTNSCTIANGNCGNAIIQHGRDSVTMSYPLGSPAGTTDTFGANSRIYRISAATYYVANNSSGEPTLYRNVLGVDGAGNPATSAEELIEGVQDMQLSYGVDTTGDLAVDSYQTADAVTVAAAWPKVLGVRISLLMVSRQNEQGITTQAPTYTYNGTTVLATDRLLRKVFTTTIAIKNRL